MDHRDNLLVSSNILYHYLSGKSNEVLVLDEWNSIAEADESIKTSGDRRKKGWPTKKTREEFQKKYSKYWAGGHTDVGNFELDTKMLKRRKKKLKENIKKVRSSLVPLLCTLMAKKSRSIKRNKLALPFLLKMLAQ